MEGSVDILFLLAGSSRQLSGVQQGLLVRKMAAFTSKGHLLPEAPFIVIQRPYTGLCWCTCLWGGSPASLGNKRGGSLRAIGTLTTNFFPCCHGDEIFRFLRLQTPIVLHSGSSSQQSDTLQTCKCGSSGKIEGGRDHHQNREAGRPQWEVSHLGLS